MSAAAVGLVDELGAALADLADAVTRLQQVDLTGCSDQRLQTAFVELVTQARRLPTVRHGFVAEIGARGLPEQRKCASMAAYLRCVVRTSMGEGRAWERDAEDLTPARSLSTGEVLPARYPQVAEAAAAGAVSTAQARVITAALRRVPARVEQARRAAGEADLVRYAHRFAPAPRARLCEAFLDCVDPDGDHEPDPAEQARQRCLQIGRADRLGMHKITGWLEPAAAAMLRAALDPLAAPVPGPAGERDPRAPEQRDHDALHELARRALTTGDLPIRHGLPATLLLTVTLEDLERRTGHASTAHGGRYSIRDLLRIAADTAVVPIVMDADGKPLHLGETQRLATLAQRHAEQVLDLGCTFPQCSVPGVYCQSAHGEPFRTSRHTTIDDLALLCGYHHRIVDTEHWTIRRVHGRVWLTPPKTYDPQQVPRTNEYFKPLE